MPASFSIRRGSHSEGELLAEMQNEVFEGSWGYSPNSVEEVEARLRTPGSGPERLIIAEDAQGRAAAFNWTRIVDAEGRPAEGDDPSAPLARRTVGFIHMTGVLPGYRGAGLGSATVAAGVAELAEAGVEEVRLEVVESNDVALRIYRRAGFETWQTIQWYELPLERV